MVQLNADAIAFACYRRLVDLVLDTRGLTGFDAPDVIERFFMASNWAEVARGIPIRIATIAHVEMIDQQKFGVTVATNRGLIVDVFATETAAIAWLESQPPPPTC